MSFSKIWALAISLLMLAGIASAEQAVLTNADIVKLVRAGLGEAVISATINGTESDFDISAEALVLLKREGVPDSIIGLILEKQSLQRKPKSGKETASLTKELLPALPQAGVYYITHDGLVFIEPVSAQVKLGSGLLGSMTFGAKKTKGHAEIPGAEATLKIAAARPSFYISTGQSSRDITLIQLQQKKKKRRYEIYSVSAYTGSDNVLEKQRIPLKVERLKPELLRVTPEADLKPGEYAFISASLSVSDFSVVRK